MNERVQAVLDAVARYELDWRKAPSVRDLARLLHCGSSKALEMIHEAADAGAIEYDPGIPRSIRVVTERCELCGR